MRRLFVILFALVLSPQIVKAQISYDPGEGCLNVVDFSVGNGFGESGSNSVAAQYVGVGYSYLNRYHFSAIPLFFSTHYFFLDQRFSPFVNLRAGIYWPFGLENKQPGVSLYVAPSVGLKVHITPHIGVLASVGYDGYLVKALDAIKNEYQSKIASGWGISIGMCFQIPGW